jgi:ornithine carbamoyltransferase
MHRIRLTKHIPRVAAMPSQAFSTVPGPVALKTRHLLSTADLSVSELQGLVARSAVLKKSIKTRGLFPEQKRYAPGPLVGRSVALLFSKRSTRTRVSTESAVALLGGHPMFLGKDDIQLGVFPPSVPPNIGE